MKLGQRNLVLTGFMGTGKTTVGRQLAQKLGRKFVDTDELIETWADRSIPEIFENKGEPAFRAWELKAAEYISLSRNLIVSTGGGFVTSPECVQFVQKSGVIICLTATPDTILERTTCSDRPLLAVPDRQKKIADLLAKRADVYGQFTPFRTDKKTPFQIADEIVQYVC